MPVSIIHLSDLHLRKGWLEEQGVVLSAFFDDLARQLSEHTTPYVLFTGDILQAGNDPTGYEYFEDIFVKKLHEIGIDQKNILIVPGNHDVDRKWVSDKINILTGLKAQDFDETQFNNAFSEEINEILKGKFKNFLDWQSRVSPYSLGDSFSGNGFLIEQEFGIYMLNTAIFSFGGIKDKHGEEIDDKGKLVVETRSLHNWLQTVEAKYRILIMHHPLDWLCEWSRIELERIVSKHFNLVLYGHIHEGGSFYENDGVSSTISCISPALFTRKNAHNLGYSLITLNNDYSGLSISYRHWVQSGFVTGAALSRTDDGVVRLGQTDLLVESDRIRQEGTSTTSRYVDQQLEYAFHQSLASYASLPKIWISPKLSKISESSIDVQDADTFSPDDLTKNPCDCIIKAPPQFGLTSLGRYLSLNAWRQSPQHFLMYIDSRDIQNHESSIENYVETQARLLGLDVSQVAGIVLDEPGRLNERKVNNIKKKYPDVPLIILHRIEFYQDIDKEIQEEIQHSYETFYLWQLDRRQIRTLVRQFNESGFTLDENLAVQRLVDDFEILNLHRSPLNCITLLAVYERQVDYSPVNRTEMMERFLHFLFAFYKKSSDYSKSPDMKDSFQVLGKYCADLLVGESDCFTKSDFISKSNKYCEDMVIDVDCSLLFDLLEGENLIVEKDNSYYFRYVHWMYFFAAHRMHHDAEFYAYVVNDKKYTQFPEIIEFYSGIDRRRDELVRVLIDNLREANSEFERRSGIDRNFDPYEFAKWTPSGNYRVDVPRLTS